MLIWSILQSGFNQCNSTTGGDTSLCQTLVMNNVSVRPARCCEGGGDRKMLILWAMKDFCIWGAPGTTPNGTIGDIEVRRGPPRRK